MHIMHITSIATSVDFVDKSSSLTYKFCGLDNLSSSSKYFWIKS